MKDFLYPIIAFLLFFLSRFLVVFLCASAGLQYGTGGAIVSMLVGLGLFEATYWTSRWYWTKRKLP